MKPLVWIPSLAVALLLASPAAARQITAEFEDIESFRDFSVYGLSAERTLSIFRAEFDQEAERLARRYLAEGEVLELIFTDIDMAGEIQPWRNRYNADIRYVESIYPPRLKFRYRLTDAGGNLLLEGEESITDLAFQMNPAAAIRVRHEHFVYELTLLDDWLRRTVRGRSPASPND